MGSGKGTLCGGTPEAQRPLRQPGASVVAISGVGQPRLSRPRSKPARNRVQRSRLGVEPTGDAAALCIDPAAGRTGQAGERVQLSSQAVILVGHVIENSRRGGQKTDKGPQAQQRA